MKILVDVNVFIDVMTKRANWQGSLRTVNLARTAAEIEGWTSALTVPLLYFFRLRVAEEKQGSYRRSGSGKRIQPCPSHSRHC